jgi:hypothetical protein
MSDDEVRAAFDVAEEIRDPLDGLADRSKLDKGALPRRGTRATCRT